MKLADQCIAELAAARRGIVTRTELRSIGVGSDAVDYRVKAGYLRPLHRGVYQVGPVACPNARERAALLACGEGAALSHYSAAGILHMRAQPHDAPVDVTVLAPRRRRIAGIREHRTQELRPDEVTRVGDLRLTTAARTILDLAPILAQRELERTVACAERQELLTREELARLLERHAMRRGTAALRRLLGDLDGPALTRSEAEERFLALVERGQLERPETNVVVARYEVDFFWRLEQLVVEVDGFAFHSSHARFERDRRRDAKLSARGFQVIRVTWQQITQEPEAVLVHVGQTLAIRRLLHAQPSFGTDDSQAGRCEWRRAPVPG